MGAAGPDLEPTVVAADRRTAFESPQVPSKQIHGIVGPSRGALVGLPLVPPELRIAVATTASPSHAPGRYSRPRAFPGSYGTLGTPNGQSNFPGARQEATAWIDGSGNFWLFGGFDLDSKGNPDALNDLWEFSGGVWTWKSGANVVNQKAVYGTVGVAAATNVPGARWDAGAWTDHNGNLWMFGGEGYDSTGNGSLGDLWEYVGGQWIWQKGPSSVSQSGNYGITPGPIIFPHVINYPGSRFAPAYWLAPYDQTGVDNALWIFGGEGFDASSGTGNGLLSDLWRYLPYP